MSEFADSSRGGRFGPGGLTLIEMPLDRRRASRQRNPGAPAFTLIEMLVVISIIMLLVAISLPGISAVMRQAQGTRTIGRINELKNGIDLYHKEIGAYPGQQYKRRSWHEMPRGENGQWLTGSQWLARAMYTPLTAPDAEDDPLEAFPTSAFCEYKEEHLFADDGREYTLSDRFDKPMAICYYFSLRTERTTLDQYQGGINAPHTSGARGGKFEDFIADPTSPDPDHPRPYNNNGYLLIAPGPDRKYFTDDDITNFRRK